MVREASSAATKVATAVGVELAEQVDLSYCKLPQCSLQGDRCRLTAELEELLVQVVRTPVIKQPAPLTVFPEEAVVVAA